MNLDKPVKTIIFFILLALVFCLSLLSNRLWRPKSEKLSLPETIVVENEITVGQFGQANGFQNPLLREIFKLKPKSELENRLSLYGSPEEIKTLAIKSIALSAENESKNWYKIAVKFLVLYMQGCVSLRLN
jgi:hypothetical protein